MLRQMRRAPGRDEHRQCAVAGFDVTYPLERGRHVVVEMSADDPAAAERAAREMCEKLLANPVIEDFEIATVSAA